MAPILTYHRIGDLPQSSPLAKLAVPAPQFEAQLRWLTRKGFHFVSLDDLRASLLGEKTLPRRSVALAFDDGLADNFEQAFPLLKAFGASATFFIVAGRIGGTAPDGVRCMGAEELRQLDAAGMAIGSHAMTHPHLAHLPRDEARRELADSKAALESILGKPVRWLCYPFGSFNREVAAMAKELGYAGACSVMRDNRQSARQIYWLPRVMVMPGVSLLRFAHYLSPLYHFVHTPKNRRRWKEWL